MGKRKKQGPAPKRCWKRTRGHRVTLQPDVIIMAMDRVIFVSMSYTFFTTTTKIRIARRPVHRKFDVTGHGGLYGTDNIGRRVKCFQMSTAPGEHLQVSIKRIA